MLPLKLKVAPKTKQKPQMLEKKNSKTWANPPFYFRTTRITLTNDNVWDSPSLLPTRPQAALPPKPVSQVEDAVCDTLIPLGQTHRKIRTPV